MCITQHHYDNLVRRVCDICNKFLEVTATMKVDLPTEVQISHSSIWHKLKTV